VAALPAYLMGYNYTVRTEGLMAPDRSTGSSMMSVGGSS